MVKIATLRQEAELLKQQTEVEKMKKELKELRGEKPLLEGPQKSLGSPFMMSASTADRELLPSPYDPKCLPDQSFSLVVELQANNAEDSTDPEMLFSKGWTKIDLFDISNRLLSGR
ncbi:PREDICTED: uncharacterized protein LOC107337954 [Acropora digitifera]|uniref:uncharacterized protein LOC107337954 n=1 Tax=Acropora digitifera TaxID=70779 RepID=UPI00077A2067|nr:PREDICTED: uncharacterized protein LOC107337954 [Acropora digitifera]